MKQIKSWFDRYVRTFEPDSPISADALRLKREHCCMVRAISANIATDLGIAGAQLRIIEATGLLHDIARFDQYLRYRTFVDARSCNHGEAGATILEQTGVLDTFSLVDKTDIISAVRFHNRLEVPTDLSPQALQLTRLVRDADKLDIYRVCIGVYRQTRRNAAIELELPDTAHISTAIVDSILAGKLALMGDLKSLNDFKLLQMAWVYDVNYTPTFRRIAQQRFLPVIRATLPNTLGVDEVYQTICSFLQRQIDRNAASATL